MPNLPFLIMARSALTWPHMTGSTLYQYQHTQKAECGSYYLIIAKTIIS